MVDRVWLVATNLACTHSRSCFLPAPGKISGTIVIESGAQLLAASGAILATTILGLGHAVVYLLGERSLAPFVISHFLVTALIEPGLPIVAYGGGLRLR